MFTVPLSSWTLSSVSLLVQPMLCSFIQTLHYITLHYIITVTLLVFFFLFFCLLLFLMSMFSSDVPRKGQGWQNIANYLRLNKTQTISAMLLHTHNNTSWANYWHMQNQTFRFIPDTFFFLPNNKFDGQLIHHLLYEYSTKPVRRILKLGFFSS